MNLQYQRMKNDIPEVLVGVAEDKLPEFTDEVENRTVVAGREAILSCHVQYLGSYKVSTNIFKLGSNFNSAIRQLEKQWFSWA